MPERGEATAAVKLSIPI